MSVNNQNDNVTSLPVNKNERLTLNEDALEAAKRSLDPATALGAKTSSTC